MHESELGSSLDPSPLFIVKLKPKAIIELWLVNRGDMG